MIIISQMTSWATILYHRVVSTGATVSSPTSDSEEHCGLWAMMGAPVSGADIDYAIFYCHFTPGLMAGGTQITLTAVKCFSTGNQCDWVSSCQCPVCRGVCSVNFMTGSAIWWRRIGSIYSVFNSCTRSDHLRKTFAGVTGRAGGSRSGIMPSPTSLMSR